MDNKFNNDKERILELETCLREVHKMMSTDPNMRGCFMQSSTLIRDVLSRYDIDKKYMTAKTIKEGPFEFLDD